VAVRSCDSEMPSATIVGGALVVCTKGGRGGEGKEQKERREGVCVCVGEEQMCWAATKQAVGR
jgi:hypothetical protein